MKRTITLKVALLFLFVVAVAGEGKAQTGLGPTLDCVQYNQQTNELTAVFGYVNANDFTVTVSVGARNFFHPSPTSRGQVTKFVPGTVHNAFKVTFSLGQTPTLTWSFLGYNVTASNDPRLYCRDDGTPARGGVAAAGADISLLRLLVRYAPGYEIQVQAPPGSTIPLDGGEIVIDNDITIKGPGADKLTLSGGQNGRVFYIEKGQVSISDITIADGKAQGATGGAGSLFPRDGSPGLGGAIFVNSGKLSLSNVVFSGNQAIGGKGVDSGTVSPPDTGRNGTYTAYQFGGVGSYASNFYGVGGGGGGAGLGGAVFIKSGSLNLDNAQFINNSATGGAGGNPGKGKGGAIFVAEDATLTLDETTTFSNNTASDAGTTDIDNANLYQMPPSEQRVRLAQLEADLETAKIIIQSKDTEISQLSAQITTLTNQVTTLQTQLSTANQTIQDKDAELAQLSARITSLSNQVTELQGQLAAANGQITTLTQLNTQLQTAINSTISSIEQDFRREFKNPQFTIPGATPAEKLQNLTNAVTGSSRSVKGSLYKSLGGK